MCEEWTYFRGECTSGEECTCPAGYKKEGDICHPECYYGARPCSIPSIPCKKKNCGECPQLTPPSPDFCKEGTIQPRIKDACGCSLPPTCVTSEPLACIEDAKICSDGSAVGRDGNRNCEFAPCPGETKNE